MTMRVLAASLAIVCGLGACASAPPEPRDEPQLDTTDDSTSTSTEESFAPPSDFTPECSGDIACPAQFNNCIFQGDIDCGEEFCRTPGAQCNGEPSTFIRTQHVFKCFDPAGNQCVSITQGRHLVHCGC
jgi:hypothetical protein